MISTKQLYETVHRTLTLQLTRRKTHKIPINIITKNKSHKGQATTFLAVLAKTSSSPITSALQPNYWPYSTRFNRLGKLLGSVHQQLFLISFRPIQLNH